MTSPCRACVWPVFSPKTYTLTERNVKVGQRPCNLNGKQFTGRFLMEVGLEVPLREEYASRVFELK